MSTPKRIPPLVFLVVAATVLVSWTALGNETQVVEQDVGVLTAKLTALGAAIGIGNLAGFGLPIVVLLVGGLRLFGFSPGWLATYVNTDSMLYSGPAMALAAVLLGLAIVAGNEKLTKSIKLPAQLIGIPPAAIFAFAAPILAAISAPGGKTTLLVDAAGTAGAGGSSAYTVGAVLWLLLLGAVSFVACCMVLMARLLVAFLVWLSPIPFVDGLLNLTFHLYVVAMVGLCVFLPPVGLAFIVLQTVILALSARWIFRFSRTMWTVVGGRIRATFNPQKERSVPAWMQSALEKCTPDAERRQYALMTNAPKFKNHTAVGLGLAPAQLNIITSGGRAVTLEPALSDGVHYRQGFLLDELSFTQRSGSETQSFRFIVPKDRATHLPRFVAELREEGFVIETAGAFLRPVKLPEVAA